MLPSSPKIWGALDPLLKGRGYGGACVSQEGRRCLLQLLQLREAGHGHQTPQGSGSGDGAPCPHRRAGLAHNLESSLFLQEPLPGGDRGLGGHITAQRLSLCPSAAQR